MTGGLETSPSDRRSRKWVSRKKKLKNKKEKDTSSNGSKTRVYVLNLFQGQDTKDTRSRSGGDNFIKCVQEDN